MELNSIIQELQLNPQLFDDIEKFSEKPGVYAFFYEGDSQLISSLPFNNGKLLYIGKTESSQKSRDANTHFRSGKTGSSTVRRSLGAVLRTSLGLTPIPRNSTDYERGRFSPFKFDEESEKRLTEWMKKHVSMSFYEFEESPSQLDSLETELINTSDPTLNIDKNQWGVYRTKLQSLRKTCAQIARESEESFIKQPVKQKKVRKNYSQGGGGMGKYSNFWNQLLPEIEEMLEVCESPMSLQLEKKTFDQLGDRNSYTFNIQYRQGKVANNLGGSAVARDLNGEIRKNMKIRSILIEDNYKINMDSKFVLWVRKL